MPTRESVRPTSQLWLLPWAVTTVVALLAIYVWGMSLNWQLGSISPYQFFPVLGLLAFSIMWSHYVAGLMRRLFLHDEMKFYFRTTGYVVLVAILLHPGILIYSRFRDGYGLPPHSYETYVAPSMAWLTLLGSTCLFVFLAFELHRWFKDRTWWPYVVAAGDLAMLGVFYHGLRLGTQTHIGWFRNVWYFYGVVLIGCLIHKYLTLWQQRRMRPMTRTSR